MLIAFADLTVPAALCFATGMYAAGSVPVLLYGTTWRRDLHQAAVHVGHDLNRATATVQRRTGQAARDAALTSAALLTLLLPASGGTR